MDRQQTLFDRVGRHAHDRGAAPAILAPGRALLTYAALYQRLHEAGAELAAAGLGRGHRIALAVPDGPEMAVATMAAMTWATCAPLDPQHDGDGGRALLAQLRADALVAPAGASTPLIGAARSLGLPVIRLAVPPGAAAGVFKLAPESPQAPVVPRPGVPGEVALLLQTSGTTATPKVVPVSHAQAVFTGCLLPLAPDDRALCVSPLFWYGPLSVNVISPLAQGASVVLTGGFDPRRFGEWLSTFEPTFYGASPAIQVAILDVLPSGAATSLRFVRASSAALPPELQRRLEHALGVPVLQGYGMTECGLVAANPMPPGERRAGSVGKPQAIDVELRDEAGLAVPAGDVGEVTVRGFGVMAGYDGDRAQGCPGVIDGWLRTGDLGRFDDDGYLYLVGRIKEQINRGGQKVSPAEVDAVLLRHGAVREAATFGVPHPTMGEDVLAAVVLRERNGATPDALRDFAIAHLSPHKVPSAVVVVDALPKNPAGKVRRDELRQALGDALATPHVEPRNPDEALIATVFAEVLGLPRVGALTHFFRAGGDSLCGARLLSRLAARGAGAIDLKALFESPTVERLAARLRRGASVEPDRANGAPPITRRLRGTVAVSPGLDVKPS